MRAMTAHRTARHVPRSPPVISLAAKARAHRGQRIALGGTLITGTPFDAAA